MTFRTAALTHCRLQQRVARVVPGAKPVAATLVAAFLFLGISAVARADDPGGSNGCSGLAPITLTASPDYVVRGGHPSAAADCGLSLELGKLPTDGERPPDAEPCIVTATPSPMGSTGLRVRVRSTGHCDGVEIRSTTDVESPVDSSDRVQASSGYAAAYAKIVGEDPIDLDMFYNKSKIAWGYTATTVNSGTHYKSGWVWSTDVWSVKSHASSFVKHGDTRYEGYHNVQFKAIQLTEADTKATLNAKPGGAFSCAFSIKWKLKPIGFGHYTECDTE